MSTTLTIECPACATAFPVDPDKVPAGGARTECTVCHTPFRVDDPGDMAREPAPETWEDEAGDADAGSIEAVVTVEDVVVDEVVTVWDAEAPADRGAEAEAWEARDDEPENQAAEAVDDEPDLDEGDLSDDLAAADAGAEEDHDEPEALQGWGTPVEGGEPEAVEHEEVEAAFGEESDTVEEVEAVAPLDADPSPLAEGIVTDQWSELVPEATEDAGVTEDADAWGGGGDDDEWVVETEDEEVTLSDLDLDVERLDTVEDQVRAAREESGLAEPADAEFVTDDEFVTGAGEELLGGSEVVLPEDALEVEGGIAEVGGEAEDAATPSPEAPEVAGADGTTGEGAEGEEVFQFGRRDPHDKARRLARVLVSDMITYNPERHEEALAQNRLKDDFEEEIDKSWAEYVEQVGPEIAESTDYWRDALNDILARGEPLF
jgi:predicted Zn finger-like uncharacterized protein